MSVQVWPTPPRRPYDNTPPGWDWHPQSAVRHLRFLSPQICHTRAASALPASRMSSCTFCASRLDGQRAPLRRYVIIAVPGAARPRRHHRGRQAKSVDSDVMPGTGRRLAREPGWQTANALAVVVCVVCM